MTTTTQLRSWWAPPCVGPWARVALYGDGVVSVRPEIVDAVHALSACLEAHSYETRAADTGAYNCRPITGGSGYSLHAYAIALDINWLSNPFGPVLVTDMPKEMVKAITSIRTRSGVQVWRWGGDYAGNKDAMHYEIVCSPAELATGLNPTTIPGATPAPTPSPAPIPEDDDMPLILTAPGKTARLLAGPVFVPLDPVSRVRLVDAGVPQAEITAADHDEIRDQILKVLDHAAIKAVLDKILAAVS